MKSLIAILMIPLAAGCGSSTSAPPPPQPPPPALAPPPPAPSAPEPEPARITVQHVLIAFRGAAKAPRDVTRSREEAGTFAREILERVRKGEDIAELARQHSTDPGGGLYTLVNTGVTPEAGEIRRGQFIKPFVDVAFKLKVGEAGIVGYDQVNSPYGWHVIKRLK